MASVRLRWADCVSSVRCIAAGAHRRMVGPATRRVTCPRCRAGELGSRPSAADRRGSIAMARQLGLAGPSALIAADRRQRGARVPASPAQPRDAHPPGPPSARAAADRAAQRTATREGLPHSASWGSEPSPATLERLPAELAVLHDRRMPGGYGNIDHLAIVRSGVFVVDAKGYRGKVRVQTPLFGPQRLLIAGRERTQLIDGLDRQVAAVREALAAGGHPGVPVQGVLCFTLGRSPLLRDAEDTRPPAAPSQIPAKAAPRRGPARRPRDRSAQPHARTRPPSGLIRISPNSVYYGGELARERSRSWPSPRTHLPPRSMQSPPRRGHPARSRPPARRDRNCTGFTSILALQSQTAGTNCLLRVCSSDAGVPSGFASRAISPATSSLTASTFRFLEPFGARRPHIARSRRTEPRLKSGQLLLSGTPSLARSENPVGVSEGSPWSSRCALTRLTPARPRS